MFQTPLRSRVALLSLLFLTALMPALVACGGSTTAAGLDNSHWNLSAVKAHDGGATPPLPGTALTLEISGDKVSGSAGCNTYSGSVKHDNGAFTVDQLAVTAKACSAPEGIMEQEQQYLATLKTASSYTIDGDNLFLYDAAHAPILSYVRSDAVSLTSTLWRMTGYATGSEALTPAPQNIATLTVFNTNGQVTGAMSGQTFNAPYKTSNDTITISAPQNAGGSDQLNAFLSALTSAKKYAIAGPQLVLTGSNGKPVVVFADTAHSPALANTTWFLRKFDFSAGLNPVASALNVTLNFDGNGRLNGVVDCNTYQGTYGASGAKIGIGDIQVFESKDWLKK
jgi:heat shock protein HslJ